MPKKNELIIIFAIIVILCLIMLLLPKDAGQKVNIYHDGAFIGDYPIDGDISLEVNGVNISIKDGAACVISSTCPGHDCVKSPKIQNAGQSIVCLPNRVMITVSGETQADTISY